MIFGKHINKYYLKYGLFMLIGIIALVIVDIAQSKVPDIIGDITDGLSVGVGSSSFLTPETLKNLLLQLLTIALILFVGRFTWRLAIFGTGVRIESDLREELFKKNERMSHAFLLEHKAGDLMTLYTNDISAIRHCFSGGMLSLVDALCLGVVVFINMYKLNPYLALMCILPLIGTVIVDHYVGKIIARKTEINFQAFGALTDFVTEDFYGIGVIKAFVKEKNEQKRFDVLNKNNMDTCMAFVYDNTKLNVWFDAVYQSITLIIMTFAAVAALKQSDTLSVGNIVRFVSYYMMLIWPLEAIGGLINLRSQGRASLKRLSTLLDAKEEINDDKVDVKTSVQDASVECRHLTFTYPKKGYANLKDVSLKINDGEMIGLISATGGGKSTLMDCLARVWNVDDGMIYIGGKDIMTIPLAELHREVAYVNQTPFLFGDTMEANVLFSRNEVTSHDREDALKACEIAGFELSKFPDGLDTIIGERGITISGGQKQRLAIARGLIADAPILILDDSLSAVDTETEAKIIKNLKETRQGKTTIIVAHRITTLSYMDKIIVLEKGVLTGYDTPANLLSTNSYYQNEVALQALEEARHE